MEDWKEDWYGHKSNRIEDIGRPIPLDRTSLPSEVGENENTVDVKSISEHILVNIIPNKVPSEAESNTEAPAIRSSNPALQERSQHEETNVLADGNKNYELADLLLSSKELPSWAMRQTAAVPPNTHRIAECQGCMKEHGAPHTCDMKEDVPSRFSDMPSGAYPASSNRHSMMPPMIMNPYAPAWSEGHQMYPPSWRHPPLPPWRQDQNSYHGHHGYEKHYYDECEDEYIRHYPLEACGRHCNHEAPRGPQEAPRGHQPHDAYIPHVNHGHSYGAMHDPAFLRSRHMEEYPPPPPPHFHQYSARKYPYVPMSGQAPTGSEWQSRSLQNCSKYETPQVCTDNFVDRINSRGDWSQSEVEQSTLTHDANPYSDVSSLSLSPMSTTKHQSDSQIAKLENYESPFQTHSQAGDFNAKATPISETKTSREQLEVVSSMESKINYTEKNRPAPPADDILKPYVIPSSTSSNNNNKAITSNNDPADSHTTISEAAKSDEKVPSTKASSADSTTPADVIKEETQPPYTRRSPCAFTIDISPIGSSAADSFSAPKLPANLAKRVAKFPRKPTPKDDKSEKALPANSTVTQQKKNISLHSSKQLADDKDKQSSKAKHRQHVSSNNTEDDDSDDDCSDNSQAGKQQWSKPMVWTKVEINSLKNDHYFKSPESGLRGTSATASRVKSKMQSDDSHNGKTNKSLEFERPSVHKDSQSISTRKYASMHKFSKYPEQTVHNVSFETEDDTSSNISETETYTVCTADQDSAVTAAREKIGEVFRVGMKDETSETEIHNRNNDLQRNSFVNKFNNDENSHTDEEDISEDENSSQPEDSPELKNFTELTSAAEVCQRKPEDVSQKRDEDACLNMQDSEDVICLTYDSSKDYVGNRKSKNETEINLASSFPLSSARRTSLSKRLLPRTPGKDDLADGAALVFESADTRSDAGDSDKGFFEVLSADAPLMQPVEKKKAGRLELNSCISETYQKLHKDGEFEVIADVPRVVEDAGLSKEKSPNDNVLDYLQKGKVLRNSLNKRDPSSLFQPEEDELKKIFFDAPRSGRITGTTATEERECVSDRKPTIHNLTGKLHPMPRFYDSVLPDETSSNHSQKPAVRNSITTSNARTILNRTDNQERSTSSNEGFVPITFGRSSLRSEGRKLPGNPTKSTNNTKSEFISRGRGSLRETDRDSYGTISLSQPSTPRLAPRQNSAQSQRLTDNCTVQSRPPSAGNRQRTVVSKAVSHSSAIVAEPGTPSRAPYVRQRSLSRPTFSRGDPQISLSRPPLSRGETQISLSRPTLSRNDPDRQQLKFQKDSSFDSSDMPASPLLSRSKQHQPFRGQRPGETPIQEKATSFDSEARMKRSKSASNGLRSRTSDAENPKLQAYHERMKYDPKKAIEDSKKLRLSASSRSDDTDASSYEELQNHQVTRQRPGSMTHSDRHSRKTSDYQPQSSFKSGTRPRSARTRQSADERLNHSTSSDIDAAYGVRTTTIPSIQNLSEDIQQLLNKIEQKKIRTRSTNLATSLPANRTTSSVDDPQLNELQKTLKKVKQVLQSKFHS